MAEHILKCSTCSRYTLQELCPAGHGKTNLPRPPKFSLQDKYAQYRRTLKKEDLQKKGLY